MRLYCLLEIERYIKLMEGGFDMVPNEVGWVDYNRAKVAEDVNHFPGLAPLYFAALEDIHERYNGFFVRLKETLYPSYSRPPVFVFDGRCGRHAAEIYLWGEGDYVYYEVINPKTRTTLAKRIVYYKDDRVKIEKYEGNKSCWEFI